MPTKSKRKPTNTSGKTKSNAGQTSLLRRVSSVNTLLLYVFLAAFVIIGGYAIYQASHAAQAELVAGWGGSGTGGPDCLDDNANGGNNSKVDIWKCNGTPAQRYSYSNGLIHIGAGCARVANASSGNKGSGGVVIGGCQTGSSAPWGSLWTKQGSTFHNNRSGLCLLANADKGQASVSVCEDAGHNLNQRFFPDTWGSSTGNGGGGSGGTSSGYRDPFHGQSVQTSRIDQGVDYNGTATVYAIGPGTIVSVKNGSASGWENGTWIREKLSSGKAAGKYVYVAEDCTPYVHSGQTVTTSTAICKMTGSHTGIEMGWASTTDTLALAHSEYYEGLATSYGLNYNQLMVSLGAPSDHIDVAKSSKKLPAGWPTW